MKRKGGGSVVIILGQAEADIHYGDNCLLCFCIRPVISLKKSIASMVFLL